MRHRPRRRVWRRFHFVHIPWNLERHTVGNTLGFKPDEKVQSKGNRTGFNRWKTQENERRSRRINERDVAMAFGILKDQMGPFRNGWTCHASISSLPWTRACIDATHDHVRDLSCCTDEPKNLPWTAFYPQTRRHAQLQPRCTSTNGKARLLFVWIGCIGK